MALPGITLSDAPTRVERFETIVVGAGVERVGRLTDVRDGRPVCEGGEPIDPRVAYFVGLRFQHRMSSSLVGGVGADAAHVAEQVARRVELEAAA